MSGPHQPLIVNALIVKIKYFSYNAFYLELYNRTILNFQKVISYIPQGNSLNILL